jgi:glycosyltransferase involved in cell wall biosynthesis
MKIDIIIATFNRAELLKRAVESILSVNRGGQFEFIVTVVDNNSSDATPQVAKRLRRRSQDKVRYLFEPRQGKSYAVNTGIALTGGDIVAFADDDEVVCDDWLNAVYQAFIDGYDYVTGPIFGEWEIEPPAWYDDRLHGVLSLFDGGDQWVPHLLADSLHSFSGGNGAIRRSVLESIGGYNAGLGKIAGEFRMCEDCELFIRLKRAGYMGIYEPRMKVFHLVPRERVTKRYFRSWHRGYGRSAALLDTLHPELVTYWLGVPGFLMRRAIEALPRMIGARLRGDLPGAFEQELSLWFMLGFISYKLSHRQDGPESGVRSLESGVKSRESEAQSDISNTDSGLRTPDSGLFS